MAKNMSFIKDADGDYDVRRGEIWTKRAKRVTKDYGEMSVGKILYNGEDFVFQANPTVEFYPNDLWEISAFLLQTYGKGELNFFVRPVTE